MENGELELQDLTLHDVLVIAELQEWDVSKSKLPKTVRQQVEKAQSQHKKDLGGGGQEVETLLRQLLAVFVGVSSEGEAGHRAEGVGVPAFRRRGSCLRGPTPRRPTGTG